MNEIMYVEHFKLLDECVFVARILSLCCYYKVSCVKFSCECIFILGDIQTGVGPMNFFVTLFG